MNDDTKKTGREYEWLNPTEVLGEALDVLPEDTLKIRVVDAFRKTLEETNRIIRQNESAKNNVKLSHPTLSEKTKKLYIEFCESLIDDTKWYREKVKENRLAILDYIKERKGGTNR